MEWSTKRSSISFYSKWHLWFAWKPVIISIDENGFFKKSWLVTVMRKGEYVKIPGYEGHWNWEYKKI